MTSLPTEEIDPQVKCAHMLQWAIGVKSHCYDFLILQYEPRFQLSQEDSLKTTRLDSENGRFLYERHL